MTPSQTTDNDTPARRAATAVIRTLHAKGHEAYLAGGCVRDELLGLRPGDYDVATDATPQAIADMLRPSRLVGAQFGVVQVRSGGVWVEVATFRTDGSYGDKRRPDAVTFSDPKADAQRRDFTINALFLDPTAPEHAWTSAEGLAPVRGRVIDLVGGLDDLRGGILRAVGDPDRRLAEDQLRALRAARFAARLGLVIDPATADAIARHAGELEGVSRERIGGELRRMLAHRTRARAADFLESLGLDGPTLHEPPRGGGGALARVGGLADDCGFAVSLAAWQADRGRADTPSAIDACCRRLRSALCLSNEETRALGEVLRVRLGLLGRFLASGVAARKRLAASPGYAGAMAMLRVEAPDRADQISAEVQRLSLHAGGLAPEPLVRGDDLLAAGLRPGPDFTRILRALYDAQLEGRGRDKAALMELLASLRVEEGRTDAVPPGDGGGSASA